MIPAEILFGTIQLVLSAIISYKLYLSVKKKPKDLNVKYFLYTFILFSVVAFFSALSFFSRLDFRVDFLVSAINIIGRGLILLAVMFFCYIPLNILKKEILKKAVPFLVLCTALFSSAFSLLTLFHNPRTPIADFGIFALRLHRSDIYTAYGIIAIGSLALFLLFISILGHLKIILENKKDDYIFRRGFLVIAAGVIFMLSIFSNYFLAIIYPEIGRLIFEILNTLALIIFLIAVLYKK